MATKLFFFFYRFLFMPGVVLFLRTMKFFLPTKLAQMVSDRKTAELRPLPMAPIWVHASSGEMEYAKPVLRIMKERFPDIPILLTYFSISAKKLLPSSDCWDEVEPLPWDEKSLISKFLKAHSPRMLLIARSDLWPECLHQCRQLGISTYLFSATLGVKKKQNKFVFRYFLLPIRKLMFQNLDGIFCVSKQDQMNFEAFLVQTQVLKQEQIVVLGDTRWDQVYFRLQNPRALRSELKPSPLIARDKIIVAGSTWIEDEKILLPAMKAWFQCGGKLILVPHEVQKRHLQIIMEMCLQESYTVAVYSEAQNWKTENILLVDQVGILADLYGWGGLAFVGGSFRSKVHSVMEPLVAGCCPVLVGPFIQNNREAMSLSSIEFAQKDSTIKPVTVVQNQVELENFLQHCENQICVGGKNLGVLRNDIASQLQNHIGASVRLVETLAQVIKPNLELKLKSKADPNLELQTEPGMEPKSKPGMEPEDH